VERRPGDETAVSQHPKLAKALAASDSGEWGPVLGIAMRARSAADRGEFCECPEPLLVGADLMCGACLRNNRDQERAAVDRLVRAHDFVPGKLGGLMCKVCTMGRSAPRHHGISEVGYCSWGEERRP
jgi:hypothetical protein